MTPSIPSTPWSLCGENFARSLSISILNIFSHHTSTFNSLDARFSVRFQIELHNRSFHLTCGAGSDFSICHQLKPNYKQFPYEEVFYRMRCEGEGSINSSFCSLLHIVQYMRTKHTQREISLNGFEQKYKRNLWTRRRRLTFNANISINFMKDFPPPGHVALNSFSLQTAGKCVQTAGSRLDVIRRCLHCYSVVEEVRERSQLRRGKSRWKN